MKFPVQLYESGETEFSTKTDEATTIATKEENVTGCFI